VTAPYVAQVMVSRLNPGQSISRFAPASRVDQVPPLRWRERLSTASAELAGSIVIAGGPLRLGRSITDGYAVVQVQDNPGVRVYVNNRRGDMHCRPALISALAAVIGTALVGGGAAGAQGTLTKSPGGDRHCVINSSGIDFGVCDTLDATPTDATGSITYSCSQGGGALNVIVAIDRGLAGSFDRAISNGQGRLGYNVYLDVGHTRIWGDGSSGTATLTDKVPGNDHPITATAFGRVFPRQNVGSGRYVDSLVVTMQV